MFKSIAAFQGWSRTPPAERAQLLIKRSGHGRELGPYGLHEFMNLKSVIYPA